MRFTTPSTSRSPSTSSTGLGVGYGVGLGLGAGYAVVLAALAALATVACSDASAKNVPAPDAPAGKGAPAAAKAAKAPKAAPAADPSVLDAHTRLGAPLRHGNLTLVPILAATDVKDDKEYLTLDEAFAQKKVKVRELENESVNTLSLENKSDLPMFVMSGEVILGGKQDRIIGKDRIIPPRQAVTVDVFCVEHGRWSEEGGTSREFRSANVLAHTNLRLQASYEGQGDVWNEVKSKNAKRAESNETDTYRAVAQSKKTAKDMAPYEKALGAALAALPERARLIGFVVVMNGEIVGVESFGSPKLFAKLSGKILRSYIGEAIDLPAPKDAKVLAWAPAAKDVHEFAKKAAVAEEKTVHQDKDGKGATKQKKGAGVAETSVTDSAPAAAQPELYKGTYKH